jgi:hypothetical protein
MLHEVAMPASKTVAEGADRGAFRLLAVSAWIVLVTVVAWLAVLIPSLPTGEVDEQLASLGQNMGLYRLGFVSASIINPAFVVMLCAVSVVLVRRPLRSHEVAGGLIVATYWLLPTLAYISQFALLPRLLETGGAEALYFGNPASVSYWLAITGYGLFGIGAMLLASRFITGGARGFGWVLAASGATSTLGLVGYSLAYDPLELASTVGGVLVIPLAVMALVAARRHRGGRP